MRLGALEAGGTKMVVSVGDERGHIERRESFPTLSPQETLPRLTEYLKAAKVEALGIGCFGPLDLNPASKSYGSITTTPKIAWRGCPIVATMRKALGVPVGLDTDVNAAALAEFELGAAKGLSGCLYATIGTGIGGGLVAERRLVHGLVHPEWGHVPLRPREDDPMPDGVCPSHKGCLEGLASGPSIEKRWGVPAPELPEGHAAWDLEAHYLAQLCVIGVMTVSPERIVLGGGVMHKEFLFPMIRRETQRLLAGYIRHEAILDHIDGYIVPPALGDQSGVTGALLLAARALRGKG